jgi:5-methylcytosine-specific restriction protein A
VTWQHASSAQERGYGRAWQRLRLAVLKRDRFLCQCARCKANARVRVATEVDHIVPKAQGGTDDMANLQAIASECHRIKTQIENGATPKRRVGVDGWPVE